MQYMDRTYVMQQHKVPVFQLGLDLWRDQVGAPAGVELQLDAAAVASPKHSLGTDTASRWQQQQGLLQMQTELHPVLSQSD